MNAVWLVAEWCRGPFFMGWHLYERDHYDGRRNRDGGWGWLTDRRSALCRDVESLLHWMGRTDLPPAEDPGDPGWSNYSFVSAFAQNFPRGIPVWEDRGDYHLRATRCQGRRRTEAECLARCKWWYHERVEARKKAAAVST